jgi:hypothetical protein
MSSRAGNLSVRYSKRFARLDDFFIDDCRWTVVLAAVMAHGCNLGAYTMAQLTPYVNYEQLKRIADWQLTEEAQLSAPAELVGAISGLDTSSRWGEGRTAASDGQPFSLPRKPKALL